MCCQFSPTTQLFPPQHIFANSDSTKIPRFSDSKEDSPPIISYKKRDPSENYSRYQKYSSVEATHNVNEFDENIVSQSRIPQASAKNICSNENMDDWSSDEIEEMSMLMKKEMKKFNQQNMQKRSPESSLSPKPIKKSNSLTSFFSSTASKNKVSCACVETYKLIEGKCFLF